MKSKFETMSRQDLRTYILENRNDDEAFHVYMDRALAEPGEIYPALQNLDDLKDFPSFPRKKSAQ
jgi:hypothetical protein